MNMVLYFFKILIAVNAVLAAESISKNISYEMNAVQKWKIDLTTDSPQAGNEHYTLENDKSIDMLFSFAHDDFYSELKKNGLESFKNQVLKGKNLIQSLVSDAPLVILSASSSDEGHRQVVSMETRFFIGKKKYFTFEKFYLYQQKSLHIVLRWNELSTPKELKLAKDDFLHLVVSQKTGPSK